MALFRLAILLATAALAACGGGSGGDSGNDPGTPPPSPAPTVSLSASPASIASGSSSTLTWNSTNATSCTASGDWSGSKATSGTQSTGALTGNKSYTLACIGDGGSVTRSVTVTVTAPPPPAPTLTLTATPQTIVSGQAAMLSWSSANATTCTATGAWSGSKATNGSQGTGTLSATAVYTLACSGVGGSVTRSATVTVNGVPPPPAPTVSLSASPASITSGGSSTLTWSSTNATSCTASGDWSGSKATSGTQGTGALTGSKSYTLACSGAGGTVSKTATVTVTAAPVPTVTLSASPASIDSGSSSTLTWSSTNASSCTASGGWSGSKATSGTQGTGALTATTTYTLACTGAGGTANRSVTVIVIAGSTSLFPLHVEAGKRYLVTAQGTPFLIQGDTPWLLMTQLNKADVDLYLDDRKAKGVNTILVELIEHYYSDNAPANWYGEAPFQVAGDFSTANDAYFDQAEYVVAEAKERGMLVMMTPAYLGYEGGSQGWYQAMGQTGNANLELYGQYIATRFAPYGNVLWVEGGDYDPPDRARMHAVIDGIQGIETTSLHTFHGARGTAALQWLGASETWLDVNTIYTDKNTVMAEAQGEYNRSTMPFFLIEDSYENETANALETRQQAWQAVLSGAAGQLRGEASIWRFDSSWKSNRDTEGARTMIYLRNLLESHAWWTLVPDFSNNFLTAGIGSGATRAPAAVASDGTFAFIYTRDVRDLTVDMGKLSPLSVRARWYDPTNGSFAAVSGSPFPNTGSRVFRPTGNNALGKTDWVLVLDANP